jgi:hypothetical protein
MTTTLQVAEHAVDAAQAAGKFPPARRAHYLAEYLTDPEHTQALLDALWCPCPEYRRALDATRRAVADRKDGMRSAGRIGNSR